MAMRETELLNLAHLRAFSTIVSEGRPSAAARKLSRAQTSLMRMMRELELSIGEPLLERHSCGVLPTPSGKTVLQRSERIFSELEKLTAWCTSLRTGRFETEGVVLPDWLLNTRRLQIVVSLARERHMPTTAVALGITQPAVSRALQVLETGSGLSLFVRGRSRDRLKLTTEGESFVPYVQRALSDLRHVHADLAASHGTVTGTVIVGSLPLGRARILPSAIAAVTREYPNVRIVTAENAYAVMAASLRCGDMDVMLGPVLTGNQTDGLAVEPLLADDIKLIVRAGHPLAARNGSSLADLAGVKWIFPRLGSPARETVDAAFARIGLPFPIPSVETADISTIRGLLLNSEMIAALSAESLYTELQAGALVTLDISLPDTRRSVGLFTRAESTPSPAAQLLITAILRTVHSERSTTDAHKLY